MKNKRDFCISAVRSILQEKRIRYTEIDAETGSVYFRLLLDNSSPCLRLADHPCGKKRPSMTFYWMVGDNAKNKQVRKRLEALINKMIIKSKIGHTLGAINKLGELYAD